MRPSRPHEDQASSLSALAGRYFQLGEDASPCSPFTWGSSAALLRWQQQQPLDSTATDSVSCSVHPPANPTYLLVNGPVTKKFADKVVRSVGANARAKVLHRHGRMRHIRRPLLPIVQHSRRRRYRHPGRRVHPRMPTSPRGSNRRISANFSVRRSFVLAEHQATDRMSEKPMIVGED